jgi:hypothetical protein
MNDLQATFAEIQAREAVRSVSREAQAAANRARVAAWSPEFARLCDGLKAAGMWGRMISLSFNESP